MAAAASRTPSHPRGSPRPRSTPRPCSICSAALHVRGELGQLRAIPASRRAPVAPPRRVLSPLPSPPTSREPKGRVFALTFPFSAVGGSLTNKVCGCYSPKLRTDEKTEKTSLDALLKQSLVERLLGTEAYGDHQSSLKWVPLPW